MEIIGIICEYNPFHNGHIYHINKIKEMYKDSLIILVMSGNFTERGDISIINKWDKTKIALNHNIDLVIELPFIFATQSADIFASTSIKILKELKVNKIIFGSETNNIEKLTKIANTQINNKEYDNLIKEYIKDGISYPSATSKAIYTLTNETIDTPNDILGLSYVREIIKQKAAITPITIKRTNDYNDKILKNSITSATSIREAIIKGEKVKKYIPLDTYQALKKRVFIIDNYFPIIKYKILTSTNLAQYQTVTEGIEYRLKKYILDSLTLEEFIQKVKTKRYTYNKIKRMLIHILCEFTKEEAKELKEITYIRVLGFNSQGQKYLKNLTTTLPVITSYSKLKDKALEIELRSTIVYSQILNESEKIEEIKKEYAQPPIRKID